ncbi:AfsR/SARP family transcriptional regulator [Actinopolyspora mzabensis]|uniref:AfsR/SARP family transcriptional regulator n=1 Tax=Actinopolyspora mzabensis TaxID=995066 RepID=UPI0015A096E7|nr:BTAD domain-containing putative transcriptional regulator [Actinopolyspora mzabensis]
MPLRSAAQRVLLAVLLLRADRSVPAEELIEHLWGEHVTDNARARLQTHVMRLRRRLDDRRLIRTVPGGYSITPSVERFDLGRFHALRAAAARSEQHGDTAEELRLLGEALALWRGRPLADVSSRRPDWIETESLDELRLETVERRNELELARGNHHRVIDQLRTLVIEHPLRERFWAQLMLALHRSGQPAQALDTYQRASTVLETQLGVDPNTELRELHLKILTDSGERHAPRSVPARLPPAIADFTGRTREVARLGPLLESSGRTCTITGTAGVGKTTLAIHTAHLVRRSYPDGQLYLNLRGAERVPMSTAEALGRLLRGLGVVPESSGEVEELVELYRDRVANLRVLLVLDEVSDEEQVRPLLPNTTDSVALLTGRTPLAGLEAAHRVSLEVFPEREALSLLEGAVGEARVRAEAAAASEIVRLCGYLPLALRAATARLLARPHWRLRKLASRLSEESRRLDELNVSDLDVRARLASCYERLDEPRRRAFRLFALLRIPDFPRWVAAPLLARDRDTAEDVLETLVDERLVDCVGRDRLGQARYRVPELFGVLARELVAEADVREPFLRMFDLWWDLAARAARSLPRRVPLFEPLPRRHEPCNATLSGRLLRDPELWFEVEWPVLRAGVLQSAELGLHEQAHGLVIASAAYCDLRARFGDWERLNRVALGRVDARTEAILLQQRGVLHVRTHRYSEAESLLELSRNRFDALDDAEGAGHACRASGWSQQQQGRIASAREYYSLAAGYFEGAGQAGMCAETRRALLALE